MKSHTGCRCPHRRKENNNGEVGKRALLCMPRPHRRLPQQTRAVYHLEQRAQRKDDGSIQGKRATKGYARILGGQDYQKQKEKAQMTDMRERLIELLKGAETKVAEVLSAPLALEEWLGIYADHLIANGVILPPCKVGDIVYPLNADSRFRAFIEKIEMNANGLLFCWVQYDVGVDCTECWDEDLFTIDDIGKTVFLDETEYLIALKESEQV